MLIRLVQQICNPTCEVRHMDCLLLWKLKLALPIKCHQSLKNQLSYEQNSFGENSLFWCLELPILKAKYFPNTSLLDCKTKPKIKWFEWSLIGLFTGGSTKILVELNCLVDFCCIRFPIVYLTEKNQWWTSEIISVHVFCSEEDTWSPFHSFWFGVSRAVCLGCDLKLELIT